MLLQGRMATSINNISLKKKEKRKTMSLHTLYGICDGLYTPQMSINVKFNLVYENKNKNYDDCTLLDTKREWKCI